MNFDKITISGKVCTGKTSLFRKLSSRLQWPTFSTGAYFREYVKKHNLILNKAEDQTEEHTKKIDNKVEEMLDSPGNLLVDAWMGGVLARGNPKVLKVLLTADDTTRFARFAQREQVTLGEAQKEVQLRDKSWFEKVSKIYNRTDFFDPTQFDLVLNTSNQSDEEMCTLILKKLS